LRSRGEAAGAWEAVVKGREGDEKHAPCEGQLMLAATVEEGHQARKEQIEMR